MKRQIVFENEQLYQIVNESARRVLRQMIREGMLDMRRTRILAESDNWIGAAAQKAREMQAQLQAKSQEQANNAFNAITNLDQQIGDYEQQIAQLQQVNPNDPSIASLQANLNLLQQQKESFKPLVQNYYDDLSKQYANMMAEFKKDPSKMTPENIKKMTDMSNQLMNLNQNAYQYIIQPSSSQTNTDFRNYVSQGADRLHQLTHGNQQSAQTQTTQQRSTPTQQRYQRNRRQPAQQRQAQQQPAPAQTATASTQPVQQQTTAYQQPAPTQTPATQPVPPMYQQPAQPVYQQPAQPVYSQPAQQQTTVYQQPAQQQRQPAQQTQPAQQQQSQPVYRQPVQQQYYAQHSQQQQRPTQQQPNQQRRG